MTIGINPEVGRNPGGAVRGPGTRVPRQGARKLRDKGMPAVEIARYCRSPGPAFIATCPRQKATSPDTGLAPPYPCLPGGARAEQHRPEGPEKAGTLPLEKNTGDGAPAETFPERKPGTTKTAAKA